MATSGLCRCFAGSAGSFVGLCRELCRALGLREGLKGRDFGRPWRRGAASRLAKLRIKCFAAGTLPGFRWVFLARVPLAPVGRFAGGFSPGRPQQNEVYLRFSPRRSAKRASPLCSRWQRRFAGPPRARGPARERSSLQPARCALSSEIVQTHVLRLNKISLARGQRRFCAKWPMRCAASPVPPGSPGRRPRRAVLARRDSSTRAPRFKREIPRFNDELKRKNFPRRAVNACGVQLGSGGAVFRSTPAEVARAQREIAAFRRGVASAVRLFEAAVLGERREAKLSLRAERQVEKPHSYGVLESPHPGRREVPLGTRGLGFSWQSSAGGDLRDLRSRFVANQRCFGHR